MESTLKKEDQNLVTIDITIPSKEAEAAYNTAVSRISQHINVNGFRAGKAPRAVVERHVGVDRIQQEALEILLPKYLSQAMYDNKIEAITQPVLKDYTFEEGRDVKITVEVEVRPEFELNNYKGINVKVEIPAQEADVMDRELEMYQRQHSSMELVLDRPSNNTDTVVIDFDGTCNGEKIQGGAAKGYALDLGHSNFIPGFAEQLVGHNINDEFTIEVKFPDDYHDEKLKGQPATFDIKLTEIKQRVLPELTDEFVAKNGKFKTVDELKADIQKYIDNRTEDVKKIKAESAIFQLLNGMVNMDLPQRMIDREVGYLVADYKQRLAYSGMDWDKFLESEGGEVKFTEKLKTEARERLKNSLIIDKIAKNENISVEQTDFTAKLTQLSMAYGITPQDLVKQFGKDQNFLATLSQQIMNDKVRDFLLENNNFEYVEVKEESKA